MVQFLVMIKIFSYLFYASAASFAISSFQLMFTYFSVVQTGRLEQWWLFPIRSSDPIKDKAMRPWMWIQRISFLVMLASFFLKVVMNGSGTNE